MPYCQCYKQFISVMSPKIARDACAVKYELKSLSMAPLKLYFPGNVSDGRLVSPAYLPLMKVK